MRTHNSPERETDFREWGDGGHLHNVRVERKKRGLPIRQKPDSLDDDEMVGKSLENPYGRVGVVERALRHWHWGWYKVLVVRYSGDSHGVVFWEPLGEFGPFKSTRRFCEKGRGRYKVVAE